MRVTVSCWWFFFLITKSIVYLGGFDVTSTEIQVDLQVKVAELCAWVQNTFKLKNSYDCLNVFLATSADHLEYIAYMYCTSRQWPVLPYIEWVPVITCVSLLAFFPDLRHLHFVNPFLNIFCYEIFFLSNNRRTKEVMY